ncbi:12050_t:CDS:1 [Acaulospora morrowiae]|uniref:Large ribosomal subunit protein uL23m n=1 Tax=Acaulospora morrowiae TaxID=94023 RepID=A0A9N8VK82_9GLOM|nr:12050_t:CDS:1 [Acaulospora morrowiae]
MVLTLARRGLKKIYFPNIIFRLVRAPNLASNQVAFRVPPKVNKLDIRDYLTHIYQVKVVDVRTMNYAAKRPVRKKSGVIRGHYHSRYKKAIVTLCEDFVYPPEPDRLYLDEFEDKAEMVRLYTRKLAGWKSRPQRINVRVKERLNKINEIEKQNVKEDLD